MTRIYLSIIAVTCVLLACTKRTAPSAIVDPAPMADTIAVEAPKPIKAVKPPKVKAKSVEAAIVAPSLIVYFGVNSASVGAKYDLTRIAKTLKANPMATVTIEGFADTTGSAKYNQKLSERRALSVAKVLRSLGVDPIHIFVNGNGELPGNLSKSRKAVITVSL